MAASGLVRRIGRAFLVQGVLIAVAAVVGVYAAEFTLREVLLKRALMDEAQHYWSRHAALGSFPLPDTRNLTGFMRYGDGSGEIPAEIASLGPGFHHLPTHADLSLVYVTESGGERLYLLFDGERVGEIALLFGLLPLAGALVVLYLSAWLTYRLARRALSPVLWLARRVEGLDPDDPTGAGLSTESLPGTPDREVLALSRALEDLTGRIAEFVERERNFTRDASHELRSPLTVIKIAADMLLVEQELDHRARNSVLRIRRAARDMEELTEAFLLLARESSAGLSLEPVCVNAVIAEELERAAPMLAEGSVRIERDERWRVEVEGSDKVLSVLIGNLLRNAIAYTDAGVVRVELGAHRLVIEDSGVGMSDEEVSQVFEPFVRGARSARGGHGVGLTIVKRLSDRFGWPVRIASEPGVGTRVEIDFPRASSEPLEASP